MNDTVQSNSRRSKASNTCAVLGFLLSLLNIAVSILLLVTENGLTFFLFSFITALISLTLCIVGVSNANRAGKGKFISVLGIIFNVMIIIAVSVFLIFLMLFAQSCASVFQGIFTR